jgi:hypothetical protein
MNRTEFSFPDQPSLRPELDMLLDDVERAYRRARHMVFDRLHSGETVRSVQLNLMQELALAHLERAEEALRAYRRDESAMCHLDQPLHSYAG